MENEGTTVAQCLARQQSDPGLVAKLAYEPVDAVEIHLRSLIMEPAVFRRTSFPMDLKSIHEQVSGAVRYVVDFLTKGNRQFQQAGELPVARFGMESDGTAMF
jgi:hypothetical protein